MGYPTYPDTQDSGVEWLGEVPKHWQVLAIKRFCQVQRGASPRPIDAPEYFDNDGSHAWVRIADVTANDHYLQSTRQKLSDLGKSFSVPLSPGKLFLSIAGSVGKPMITKIHCCIHDGFVYFPSLEINPEFLYYIFSSGQPYLGLGKLGTQLNLNTDTVGGIKIALPPEPEVEAIVGFLHKKTRQLDNLIAKKQQLINKLNEKRIALITQAVTKGLDDSVPMKDSGVEWLGKIPHHWSTRRFKFLATINNGADYKHIEVTEGYPVFGSGGQFTYASEYMHTGEVVLLGRKGTIDKPLYFDGSFWAVDTMFYATPVEQSTVVKFLYYVALTIPFGFYATGTALPSMTQSDLGDHTLALPPENECRDIARFLDKQTNEIDRLISAEQKLIDKITEYRTALITAAVTGKIDVRNIKLKDIAQ